MKKRKVLNISMAVLTVVVMSYQATGGPFHDAAGVLLLLLYISHNTLNRKWFQHLLKGSWNRYRILLTATDLLALVSMLAAMGTGIYISQTIFAPLWGMRESYLIRPVHVAAGAWGLIWVSFHCGMHIRKSDRNKILMILLAAGIILAGISAFFALDMPARLIFHDTGKYWNHSGILLFIANAAVMGLFMMLGSMAASLLKRSLKRERQNK